MDSLTTSGYQVDLAATGNEALSRGAASDYAVITIDRMLPDIDGIAVMRQLRDDGIAAPVLIISALFWLALAVKTLRQLAIDWATTGVEFIGTPEQVARKMGETMEEIGGDGFLIMKPGWDLNRNYISSITDGLVPELQRLGLTRTEYTGSTLRETLREF